MFTFFFSSFIAFVRALKIPNVVSKCGVVSQGRVVEGGVVSVVPSLPDGVASACVGLLRLLDRFSQDVQCLYAGTIDNIGLSTLTSQRAEALSLLPGGTVAGE